MERSSVGRRHQIVQYEKLKGSRKRKKRPWSGNGPTGHMKKKKKKKKNEKKEKKKKKKKKRKKKEEEKKKKNERHQNN